MKGQGMDAQTLRQLAEIFREEADRNSGVVVDRTCNILRRLSDRLFEVVETAEVEQDGFSVGDVVVATTRLGGGVRAPLEIGTRGTVIAMHGDDYPEVEFEGRVASWGVHISEIEKVDEE